MREDWTTADYVVIGYALGGLSAGVIIAALLVLSWFF